MGKLWALCAGGGSAGEQEKTLYVSTNSGHTWHAVIDVVGMGDRRRPRAPAGGIPLYGYALGIAFAPDGSGILWEGRGRPYLSHDGGHHWQPLSFATSVDVDFGDSAAVLSSSRGFILVDHTGGRGPVVRLLATVDGGKHWSVVRSWQPPPAH